MECNICQSKKKLRSCSRLNQEDICRVCCAKTRNWCECPVTCRYIKQEIGSRFYYMGGVLEQVDGGDVLNTCNYLFLPNLYECISFELLNIDMYYKDLQTLNLNLKFKLEKNFATENSDILSKENWKKKFYPFSINNTDLHPLIGISSLNRGLYSLKEINMSPHDEFDTSLTHWIIAGPHQRPIIPITDVNREVNFLFARNLMIFGKLQFENPYELDIKLYRVNEYQKNENLAKTRIGLVVPFNNAKIAPLSLSSPPNALGSIKNTRIFSQQSNAIYPGENPEKNGVSFTGTRNNKNVLMGKLLMKNLENQQLYAENGPFYCSWNIDFKPEKEIMASILSHDTFVNPKLLPMLLKWAGNIACPLHVNLINASSNTKNILIKCTEQASNKSWSETVTIRSNKEEDVPLKLSGIRQGNPGPASIFVEIFENNNLIHSEDLEINVLPEDHLLLRIHDVGRDWYRDTIKAVVCWLTPHDPKIDQWIKDSRNHLNGRSFIGNQGDPIPQIKALWAELEKRGFSYVTRSYSIGRTDKSFYQRITKPTDTLNLLSGNCIDLTVLFASALEYLALEPLILLIPGHAFVGWEYPNQERKFLETTLIGNATFEDALNKGMDNYRNNEEKFNKEKQYFIFKVSDLRKMGLVPIF